MDFQTIWDIYLKFPALVIMAFAITPLITAFITSVLGNISKRFLVSNFGDNSQLIVGGVGVVVHELGHGIFALIFGHKITNINLLNFRYKASDTLGSVEREWNTDSVYQQVGNFFIGIAPYYMCSITLFVIQSVLLKNPLHSVDLSINAIQNDFFSTVKNIMSNDWAMIFHSNPFWVIICIILAIMIGSTGYDLSSSDKLNTLHGLLPYAVVLMIIGIIIELIGFAAQLTPMVWYCLLLSIVFMLKGIIYILISIIFTGIFFSINTAYAYAQEKKA